MSTTDVPATDFASIAAASAEGFGAPTPGTPAAPATPAAAPAPAAPAVPAAPAAPAAVAKPADGSLLGKKEDAPAAAPFELKADGMHADDLKSLASLFGEHKIEGKAAQAILDKSRETLRARADAQLAEAQTGWRAENAKDATAAPRIEAALSVVSPEVREALRNEVYIDHPALYRFVAEFGAFVQKATKQDTAVNGASPSPAPKFEPSNTSSAAFAGGVASGF